ncbi:MAG TPA: hypothetical protein VNE17_12245, partial [Nitrolancea sp.]|nr:hypothetical protein [Nitrolancea sp.]
MFKRWLSLGAAFALVALLVVPMSAGAVDAATAVTLSPTTQVGIVGGSVTVTATVYTVIGQSNVPAQNVPVNFTVIGANATTGSNSTNSQGQASFTVPGPNSGTSTVTATAGTATSDSATIDWISTTATKFTLTPTSI